MNAVARWYRFARQEGLRKTVDRLIGRLNKLNFVQFGIRSLMLPSRVRHLSGPRTVSCGPDELIAISVMRNGELWLRSFLAHHRRIGISHFVILDNGSTDATIPLLQAQDDVTLLSTDAPYHAYENTMKRYLADRFCRDRWCLCVDVDELFDYPFSTRVPLAGLLGYLNSKGFNAVITQMLDMFGEEPLREQVSEPHDDLRRRYPFYDISDIARTVYPFPVPDPRIRMHHGGIRKTMFGTRNGITKISLFCMDGKIEPFVWWHHARNAVIADVAGVLLHFPFVGSFYAKVVDAVRTGTYGYLTSDEYASYLKGLERSPDLRLKQPTARELLDVDQLLDEEIMVASDDYRRLAESEETAASVG